MISQETRDKWAQKFDSIMAAIEQGKLTPTEWEVDFLKSVGTTLDGKTDISFKQSSVMSKIYGRIE